MRWYIWLGGAGVVVISFFVVLSLLDKTSSPQPVGNKQANSSSVVAPFAVPLARFAKSRDETEMTSSENSLAFTTPSAIYSYTIWAPLNAAGLKGPVTVRIRLETKSGAFAVAMVKLNANKEVMDPQYPAAPAADGPHELSIRVANFNEFPDLVIRNFSSNGPSKGIIYSVEVTPDQQAK